MEKRETHRCPLERRPPDVLQRLENPKCKPAFLFVATSGLRSSELRQLTIDDINEDKKMLVPDKSSMTKQT